ncbi:MAG: hypothetical protein ACOCWZ_03780 [Spirochaetota bacterium]
MLNVETKNTLVKSTAACFAAALVFAFIPFWPLVLIAGLAGGWLAGSRWQAAVAGFTGVAAAWLVYMVIQWQWGLVAQMAGVIIGDKGLGPVMVAIILLCGGLLGLLGSIAGRSTRTLVSA